VFDNRRKMSGGRGIGANYLVDGKPWQPNWCGTAFPGVTPEQLEDFEQRLRETKNHNEREALLALVQSSAAKPPADAIKRFYCQYTAPRGRKLTWQLPFTPAQRQALKTIAESDLIWTWDTNLWSFFGLPADREQFVELIGS
jgi:hypothetical protein